MRLLYIALLAAFAAGGVSPAPAAASPAANVNGVWKGYEGVNGGVSSTAVFSFSQHGNKLTGSETAFNHTAPLSGTIVCAHLKFDVFGSNGYVAHFVGDLASNGKQVAGGWNDAAGESGSWQATPSGQKAGAPRAQRVVAAACKLPPTLELAGHRRGRFFLDPTVTAFGPLTNSTLKLSLAPGDYLTHFSGAAASRSGGSVTVKKTLGKLGSGKHVFHISADVASLFAGAGQTVTGMNHVGGPLHWSKAAPARASTGGDKLVFSDSPEYLLGKPQHKKKGKPRVILPTELASGRVAGDQVEGILYKQTDQTASGDFRVYLNHENRTPVPKLICVVIEQAIVPPAAPGQTQLTEKVTGEGEKPGDPVDAGRRALASYESHRRSARSQTVVLDGSNPAYTRCFGPIVDNGAAGVINAILDYRSSAAVSVGVVAINADPHRKGQFASNPLSYRFADNKHPKGDPARTYATDGPLHNPGETHVAGTFDYDEVTVNAMVDLSRAQPFGMLLAGDPPKSPGQYEPARDRGKQDNKGNYGVFYHVTLTVTGSSSERAEIVFNPRGVGKTGGVTNAFAGIADVPSVTAMGTLGREIPIPSSGAIKNSQDGTVLGTVNGGQRFSFDFMPPGGASGPDAIVVLPEFIRVTGTLGFSGGSATGTPNPLFVGLR
jgi:hypothetical protein